MGRAHRPNHGPQKGDTEMPADINSMAFMGETPWHGLGTLISHDATVEEWRELAGLQWGVAAPEGQFTLGGEPHPSAGHRVLVRTDNMHVFDTVGSVYQPFQNDE